MVVETGADWVDGTVVCGVVLGTTAMVVVVTVEVVVIDVAAVLEVGLVGGGAEVSTSTDESPARSPAKAAIAARTTSPASATPSHGHACSQMEFRAGFLSGCFGWKASPRGDRALAEPGLRLGAGGGVRR